MPARTASDDDVATWQDNGWVLVEGLVPTDEIDAAVADLSEIFPSAEAYHADPDGERERWLGHPPERPPGYVWPEEGPGFRPDQHRWQAQFPFPGSGALNRLVAHPAVSDFAEHRLQSTDIRLYQIHLSAKYTGETNYEQPMHTDRNHCGCPPRSTPPWWYVETFLYLSDVDEGNAATHLLPARPPAIATGMYGASCRRAIPSCTQPRSPRRASAVRCSRTAPTFSTAASTSRRPDAARFLMALAFKPRTKTGSATRHISRSPHRRVGSRSPRDAPRASSSCSASRRPDTRSGTRRCSTRRPCATRISTSGRGVDR